MKHAKLLSVIVILVAIIAVAYSPFLRTLSQLSILGVSNVQLEPTGFASETGEWMGSFWLILATTSGGEEHEFLKFDNSLVSSASANRTSTGQQVVVRGNITVQIITSAPYWEREVEIARIEVTNKMYGGWVSKANVYSYGKTAESVDPVTAEVYRPTGTWILHTPFSIVVTKVGENAFTQTFGPFDSVLTDTNYVISNPADPSGKEKMLLTVHSKLLGGYGQPSLDDFVMFKAAPESFTFKGSDIVSDLSASSNSRNSYANYWFGVNDFTPQGSGLYAYAGLLENSPVILQNNLFGQSGSLLAEEYPGWYRSDDFWNYRAYPIKPDIYQDNASTTPYGKSLVNYLKDQLHYETVNWNGFYGKSFLMPNSTFNKVRLYMPFASANNLFTLRISTEFADTYVYKTSVGDFKITDAYWFTSHTKDATISDADMLIVKVRNALGSDARADIACTPSSSISNLIRINPVGDSAIIGSQEQLFQFTVTNLGTDAEVFGTILITVKDSLGNEDAKETVNVKLLKKSGTAQNRLTVYVVERDTSKMLPSMLVTIKYGVNAASKQTTLDGKAVFELANYQGLLTIYIAEDTDHQATKLDYGVGVGENTAFVYVDRKSSIPLWAIGVAAIAVIVIVALILKRKK